MTSAATASATGASAAPNKRGLTLEEDCNGAPTGQNETPCETPKGYRAISLDITPTAWKTDLSKCNVCEDRFTWLNHRHKCRSCQEAVCNSCSKSRKVLRAHTAPKRVCDSCIQKCWTPRDAKDSTATVNAAATTTIDVKTEAAKGKDGRRVSLTVSTCDANACETDATATAPLSPGTPAAAGFFPGLVTPSAASGASASGTSAPESSAAAGTAGEEGGPKQSRNEEHHPAACTTASTGRRSHRRQASVAMPPPSSLASPVSLSVPPASTMPPPQPPAMVALPPPTPAGDEDDVEGEGYPSSRSSTSAATGQCGGGISRNAQLGPFFGGRPKSRRESSGGRLEGSGRGRRGGVGLWGGIDVGSGLGGGVFDSGYIQDVDMAVEGEDGQQVEEIRAEHQQASSSARPASLPVLPEETASAIADRDNETMKQQQQQQQSEDEDEDDDGEGGPMMIKMSGWPGVVLGAVAIGSGVAVAVLVRSAFSLVFFY